MTFKSVALEKAYDDMEELFFAAKKDLKWALEQLPAADPEVQRLKIKYGFIRVVAQAQKFKYS
jgi:hypothetical protein